MIPSREIYWNIAYGWLVYPLSALVLLVLGYGLYRRYRVWQRAATPITIDRWRWRLASVLSAALGQGRVVRSPFAGTMHLLLYCGFVMLFLGTLMIAVQEDLRVPFLAGSFYLYYSLILDIFGGLAIIGLLGLAARRYLQRPANLDSGPDDALSLGLLGLSLLTGYIVEGLRIGVTELGAHEEWAVWSPVGLGVARVLAGLGMSAASMIWWHRLLWWLHMGISLSFLATFGWSKMSHVFLAQANVFFRSSHPFGSPRTITDFSKPAAVGAGRFADLTFKQRLSADACIHAGRCQENCPAYISGKPLNPKRLLVNLQAISARARADGQAEQADLLKEALNEEGVWACTTCGACSYHCPVLVEPLDVIMDQRRRLVMGEGRLPETAQMAMLNLQKRGHPWTGTKFTRTDWMNHQPVRKLVDLQQGEQVEVLFWVGCAGALVERNIRVTQSMARLLHEAGVRFAVLGDEEMCTGDPARRMGNEFLFQQLARKNIRTLNSYGVRRIVTACPHCFNTLKNEYPQLGGTYEVVHHAEYLSELVRLGRLRPSKVSDERVTYHDPCYLGRYNGIYQPPRDVVAAVPGTVQLEMPRCREKSFCCGAGGGHAFIEERSGQRINHLRSLEAVGTGATVLASACPFCLQMFEEGLKAVGGNGKMRALDIAEVLELGLVKERQEVLQQTESA